MDFKKIKNGIFIGSFFGLIFIFFIVFFTKIHPIVISDTDDWYYTFYHRNAVPLWGNWNPTRIFAEILMPLVSEVCAYTIYPVNGDLFKSLTLGYAFILTLSITILMVAVYKYFCKKYSTKLFITISMVIFFILCHFWIFRTNNIGNSYMFKTVDACTYFYYVIPNIINCILVLCIMQAGNIEKFIYAEGDKRYNKKAFFIIFAYLCIFSNIWASIVMASFIGAGLLFEMVCALKNTSLILMYILKTRKQK